MRGAIAGGRVLATEIVSRRLCPGTPSNVCEFAASVVAARTLGFGGVSSPMRSDAARVMRGATAGGAVDAT